MDDKLLTLFIAERLLQHGENDRIVQDKITEVAASCDAESGVANQGIFIEQAACRGRPARRRKGPQHLHDTGEHQKNAAYTNMKKLGQWVNMFF